MASKLQIITAMFNDEVGKVTSNLDNWTSFLKTASNNFKYNFVEQILIYGQRPDATACAEIGVWNDKMHRWVNRGATGIALFDYSGSYQKLRYVFDVSDTNSFYGNEVHRWEVKESYHDEISEALINAFGDAAEGGLESVIDDTARNMVEDNILDYLSAVNDSKYGSFLEELDDDNISVILKNALSSSIGYMIMTRCGINADEFYDREDFKDIFNFNTPSSVIAMGMAVSDIAEMGLREIESTVKNIEKNEKKQIRTFDNNFTLEYDKSVKENTAERSNENVTDELQTSGRLQNPEPDLAERGEHYSWKVRYDEEEIPTGTQESILRSVDSKGRTDENPKTDGNRSRTVDDSTHTATSKVAGSDGETQRAEPNEMGSNDEQHQNDSRGNSPQGPDLQLSAHDFDARWNGIEYFHQDKEKNELIKSFLTPYKEKIAMFYESQKDSKERSDFIKSFFNSAPYETTLSNGVKAGFESYSDAIRLWRDDGKEFREAWEKWFQIERSVFGMILIEEWTEPQALLLPGVENQIEFIGAKVKDAILPLPQGAIDYVLGVGSGVSEGKMRVYRQFTESLSKEDNINFLKDEYGTGGRTDAIPGTGYWENHDSKGIEISDHYSVPERRVLLKWNHVEKRISELIKLNRYLSPKEKEMYPQWLENKLVQEAEWKKTTEIRQFIREAPEEQQAPKEYRYEYNLGDTVYIGADEYTILSLDDPVILNDSQYPLFNKEFSKADFEKKVKENPSNNHLRVEIEVERPIEDYEVETEVDESNKPDFLVQYEQVKKENPDGVLLMHTGGFYIAFGKDAETLSNYTHYVAPRKNFYGNVFTSCCEVLDFNLSYCQKELSDKNNIDIVIMEVDKGVVDRYPTPTKEEPKETSVQKDTSFKNEYNTLYTGYLSEKSESPDKILLYQVGDFFEAFNDDAKTIAKALDLTLTSRPVGKGERVPLVGLPKHTLETYLDMLTDRGFDVAVCSLENGERKTVTLVSQNKEDLVESKPVGRIDYLGTGGKVRESIEYTSEYQFVKDIKEENYYGVPMKIYVYADENGKTISTNFQSLLDPPPQGFKVIESPYFERAEEEIAKELTDAELIGKEVVIDGSKFVIEKIDPVFGDVSMRDTSSIYPINRVEKIGFVREYLAPQKATEQLVTENELTPPTWEQKTEKVTTLLPTIPESEKHNFRITDDNLGVGGQKEKFRNNMAAINLLHELEFENRLATPEEQEILSKYVGFGGLADAFDESKGNWADEF